MRIRVGYWCAVVALLLAPPAIAQIADAEGDADIPCVDITSLDVRGDTQGLTVTLQTSMRPYPPQYRVKGIDVNDLRLCPDGQYEFLIDTNGDGAEDVTLVTFVDRGGHAHTSGADGLQADVDVDAGRIIWTVPNDSLGLTEYPADVSITAQTGIIPSRAQPKLIRRLDTSDDAPDDWIEFTIGATASALIGPLGGALLIATPPLSGSQVVIPASALEELVAVVALVESDPKPAPGKEAEPVLRLLPAGLRFATPAQVILPAKAADFESVYRLAEAGVVWEELESVDCTGGWRCAATAGFSWFKTQPDELCHYNASQEPTPECHPLGWHWDVHFSSPFPPVLLVHGLQFPFCGKGDYLTWGNMPHLLRQLGVDVWELDYGTNRYADDIASGSLKSAVDAVLHETGSGDLTIVAHSFGGIVARASIQYHGGDAQVARLITLGSPHLGSRIANMCPWCKSCTDMGYPAGTDAPYWLTLADDTAADRKTLTGPEPQYTFIAGQRYFWDFWTGTCVPDIVLVEPYTGPSDGAVTTESALAWDPHQSYDMYPDLARRVTLDHYAHTGSIVSEGCGDRPLAAPDNPDDPAFQVVRDSVRFTRTSCTGTWSGLVTYFRENDPGSGQYPLTLNCDTGIARSGACDNEGTITENTPTTLKISYRDCGLEEVTYAISGNHMTASGIQTAYFDQRVYQVSWDLGRYEVVRAPGVDWLEAEAACEADGGHLATITSAEENARVAALLTDFPAWIGGCQDTQSSEYWEPDGGWRWVTPEPWGYTNWWVAEPNNLFQHEDFVEIYNHTDGLDILGRWNDLAEWDLTHVQGYVCEYGDGLTPTPCR